MKFIYSLVLFALVCCTAAKKETADSVVSDSISSNHVSELQSASGGEFKGEYLVGDGTLWIKPVDNAWEISSSSPTLLYAEASEDDTVSVYITKDRSVIFRMYPGHERGMYYEDGEQWPVSRIAVRESEETEAEELDRIMKARHEEDEKAYNQLGIYSGEYTLSTESEGAVGKLKLIYEGERVFSFELSLEVPDVCSGIIKDKFVMDRTQHGFYDTDDCLLHFNLNGYNGSKGFIVEIEQPGSCSHLSEDCIFSGTYTTL